MKKWMLQNWFLLGLLIAAFAAWLTPGIGASGGLLRSEITTKMGVVLIFFFQGLTLSLQVMKKGMLQWKLHLYTQAFIFAVIPALCLIFIIPLSGILMPELAIGFFFLAALPTTIATSVAYTAMTRGNVAGAVFNSTLANLAGIFITPFLLSIWMQTGGTALPLSRLFLDISMMLLAPLLVGQIVRPFVSAWADQRKKLFSMLSSIIIIYIVYAAFCNSWQNNIWGSHGAGVALTAAFGGLFFFISIKFLVYRGIKVLKFNHEDAMAALFCAPQKTLAAGAPMASLIFASQPGLGIILLPLMFYHIFQLFIGGVLVNKINQSL
ncbi:bile acid:sodium symporter family protein [Desulfonatronovibrio magnus]|uniref:bile acid:sodium symporter family protein n=1 Tax=Desulfonatronovibrio magnus TaxID=698827 RepID=UPI0005EBD589|nr:bile acid:sodium symporter family protein [Desulfonatronovibrio magnus]